MKKKVITSKAELDAYIQEQIKKDELELRELELEINRIELEIENIKKEMRDEFERIILNIHKRNGTPNGVNNLC
jgi:chromosome segregation ATPase